MLAAVREAARELPLKTLIPVVDAYLFNDISGGMSDPEIEHYKLWPSSSDRRLYREIADNEAGKMPILHAEAFYKNGKLKTGAAPRLLNAYWYLFEQIRRFTMADGAEGVSSDQRLNAIMKGVSWPGSVS